MTSRVVASVCLVTVPLLTYWVLSTMNTYSQASGSKTRVTYVKEASKR